MIPIEGQPILTAAQMRAAEDKAIAAGTSVEELMERAGAGVAEAVRRLAMGAPVLVLCGPGNNGGDGYVAARIMKANGVDVRVAAASEPKTPAAIAARQRWDGDVEQLPDAHSSAVLIDGLFGTGLARPLTDYPGFMEAVKLSLDARFRVAIDLPSGMPSDTGGDSELTLASDLTLALGALKPAHVLQPAAAMCGTVKLLDIGIDAKSTTRVAAPPMLFDPRPDSHKYNRGMVAIIAGDMAGAAALAAESALRIGAGYVLLLTDEPAYGIPRAVVQRPWEPGLLEDKRLGSILIGPGLGRTADAARKLDKALATDRKIVVDGDAIHLLADGRLESLRQRGKAILTPHAGEFAALFGQRSGSKIEESRRAANEANSAIVYKGSDTVVASPEDNVTVYPSLNPWLSTAGTGDVLAGAIAGLAASTSPVWAAAAATWFHAEAARRLGRAFVADDLARAMSDARSAGVVGNHASGVVQ